MHPASRHSDISADLRFQIADLLARAEATAGGLEPRTAALALIETAYAATLTYCDTDDLAQQDLHALIEVARHSRARQRTSSATPTPTDPPTDTASPRARLALVIAVTVLSWATIIFMSRRATLSPWNLLGPAFCTVLALGAVHRFLVANGWMRARRFFARKRRR